MQRAWLSVRNLLLILRVSVSSNFVLFCRCQDPSQCTDVCPRHTTHTDDGTCPSTSRSLGNDELIEQELCWNSDHCQTSKSYLIFRVLAFTFIYMLIVIIIIVIIII